MARPALYGQGNRPAMNRGNATLASSTRREGSDRTQVANSFIVTLRLGDGLGMQIFVPPGFCALVCRMPWANPLQKFRLAALALLVGTAVQAPARSSAVRMFKFRGPPVTKLGRCGRVGRPGTGQGQTEDGNDTHRAPHGTRSPLVGVLLNPRNRSASGKYSPVPPNGVLDWAAPVEPACSSKSRRMTSPILSRHCHEHRLSNVMTSRGGSRRCIAPRSGLLWLIASRRRREYFPGIDSRRPIRGNVGQPGVSP